MAVTCYVGMQEHRAGGVYITWKETATKSSKTIRTASAVLLHSHARRVGTRGIDDGFFDKIKLYLNIYTNDGDFI